MFDCGVIQDLLLMARRFERVNPMEPGMASKHFVKVRLSLKSSFFEIG